MYPHIIFGSENAESDDLLYDCAVNSVVVKYDRPILIGKWGAGKTGILFLQHKVLSDSLRTVAGQDKQMDWYLRENSLNLTVLMKIWEEYYDKGAIKFRQVLEYIWLAEILRLHCRVLNLLRNHIPSATGEHWNSVHRLGKMQEIGKSIWTQGVEALSIASVVFSGKDIEAELRSSTMGLTQLMSHKLYDDVKKCVKDANRKKPIISVAIEPIETPRSSLERLEEEGGYPSLSNLVMSSLINTYHRYFEPSTTSPFNVRIAVPWHRYIPDMLYFPQKIVAYKVNIEWGRHELYKFINRRIAWEFKRVGRRVHDQDNCWYDLFPNVIPNMMSDPPVAEDSFNYVLRHTMHRPRDVQRLTRTIVEHHAQINGMLPDEVLKARDKITPDSVRYAIRSTCYESSRLLIVEGLRRYPELRKIVDVLYGLSLPFSQTDLKRRIQPTEVPLNRVVQILWEAGILGISVETEYNGRIDRRLQNSFIPHLHRVEYRRERIVSWNWFAYNCTVDPIIMMENLADLLARDADSKESDKLLVLHPMTFEYFTPRHFNRRVPIGI